MSDLYLVKEFSLDGTYLQRFYTFAISEQHFYRDVRALNAFFYSNRSRNTNKSKGTICSITPMEYHLALLKLNSPFSRLTQEDIEKNPPTECTDIWEFFSKIGWNHKAKKYENSVPVV